MTAIDKSIDARPSFAERLDDVLPALLFGLRMWAATCLAFYVAFSLELSQPSWAATTAALVCQPALGASLRKASYRLIGTLIGAAAAVALAALFRQDRFAFLFGLAFGCAASAFVGTLLKNFAAYGAALAGFTMAILASDILGPTGDANGDVVVYAVNRAVEIGLGVLCAGVVLTLTDLGHARRKLAVQLAQISAAASQGLVQCLRTDGPDQARTAPRRRALLGDVIALDPLIDTAVGEASDLRRRSPVLQQAVGGLIETLTAWRRAAVQITRMSESPAAKETAALVAELPLAALSATAERWLENPAALRGEACAAARRLARFAAATPSQRLLADAAAEGMLGAARALNGLQQAVDPRHAINVRVRSQFNVPDWLPAFVNAGRAFVTVAVLSLIWIETAWPSGTLAITFGAAVAVLFALQGDQAYSASLTFLAGCFLAAGAAAMLVFFVLPAVTTFAGLCLALGLVLVPAGFLNALPWRPTFFFAASVNLIPMLSIGNAMTFDAASFWNSALAILGGIGVATILMRAAPPLTPAYRTRRLLALILADLRRLAARGEPEGRRAWEGRARARLMAIPQSADPLERAEASSALAVGVDLIRLRDVAPRFVKRAEIERVLDAIAQGDNSIALARLADVDRALAALPPAASGRRIVLRLRASLLAIGGELNEFASFYEAHG
jgi:uncharacterized membrane protein YccC